MRTAQFVNEQNGGQLALFNAFRDPLKDECVALRSLLANSRLDSMARTPRYIALAMGDNESLSKDAAGVVSASAGTASQSRQSMDVVDDIDGLCSQIAYVGLLAIAADCLISHTHHRYLADLGDVSFLFSISAALLSLLSQCGCCRSRGIRPNSRLRRDRAHA